MRLSTEHRDLEQAVGVIRAALDGGVTFLDTADVYCQDHSDIGHNERLIEQALRTWSGDRSTIIVATKGGLTRPGGRWVPDGRAKHLRAACEASRAALDVEVLDLYQLHVVDPKTPITTSLRALATLQSEGKVRAIGLCNVKVGHLQAAREIAEIASVQVNLSPFDDDSFRDGVAEYCRDHDIRLIASRPLGGERAKRLAKDAVLIDIATRHGSSPWEVALAWLADLDRHVFPIPGATSRRSARSLARVATIEFTDAERERLDARFPTGRLLRVPRAARRPARPTEGEVVIVMGMPAAGKTTVARQLEKRGYQRLNRDVRGGRVDDLIPALDAGLTGGGRRWVLDNTYPARRSRNAVIECAWKHGLSARCVWLTTSTEDAQINAVTRLIRAHGSLPRPEALRARSKQDPSAFLPTAQFRYERELEPPALEEGFTAIDELHFTRERDAHATAPALLLEYDDVICSSRDGRTPALDPRDITLTTGCRATLARYYSDGWKLLGIAWRPQVAAGKTTDDAVQDCFARTRELLALDIDLSYCPHPPGPPACWCRKPLPGLALELILEHGVAANRSMLIGRSPADRTLARRLEMEYRDGESFFKG